MFVHGSGVPKTSAEFGNDCELFRMNAMRAEVDSVSRAYDPILYCYLLDDTIALSKFSSARGSTTLKLQDPDSVIVFF